jgi:hypothetical protein
MKHKPIHSVLGMVAVTVVRCLFSLLNEKGYCFEFVWFMGGVDGLVVFAKAPYYFVGCHGLRGGFV